MHNTHYAASSATAFELQTSPDELPDCNAQSATWPSVGNLACGPSLNTVNIKRINSYIDYQYDSERIARKNSLLGVIAEFSGSFSLSKAEFKAFVLWYRCQMLAGNNKVDAPWLVRREIGAWQGSWAEPWSATYNNGRWQLSIKLNLLEDAANDAWAVWRLEDAVIDGGAYITDVCNTAESFACLYYLFNNRMTDAVESICETTDGFACLFESHNDRMNLIVNDVCSQTTKQKAGCI